MASLYELNDTGTLLYDTVRGQFAGGDGGVPRRVFGWMRTGAAPSTAAGAGTANCNGWISASNAHRGTVGQPRESWDPTSPMTSWQAADLTCNFAFPVWCVED